LKASLGIGVPEVGLSSPQIGTSNTGVSYNQSAIDATTFFSRTAVAPSSQGSATATLEETVAVSFFGTIKGPITAGIEEGATASSIAG